MTLNPSSCLTRRSCVSLGDHAQQPSLLAGSMRRRQFIGRSVGERLAPALQEGRAAMKISRMLAAAACAVALLGTAPAAFAQRASGGGPGAGFVGGPAHFSRPYYAFQPHWNLGFGLWAGDPFAYLDAFYSPFFYYPHGSSYSDDSAFPHYPGNFPSSDDTAPTYSTSWSSLVQ